LKPEKVFVRLRKYYLKNLEDHKIQSTKSFRDPPWQNLRAFEVSARLLSFTKAAIELNLTPAAISHQIRSLESRLGVPLFERDNNKLSLTAKGEAYVRTVRDALDMISVATDFLRGLKDDERLRISVLPIFATRWLIPRLPIFKSIHPEISVHVSTAYRLVDFLHEDIDAGVRYGSGDWPGLKSWYLFGEEVVPVCSRRLWDKMGRITTPSGLDRITLVHSANTTEYWRLWLTAVGADGVESSGGITYDNCLLALEAARAGLGMAMVNRTYLADEIDRGDMIAPFEVTLPRGLGCYFVCAEQRAEAPGITAFRNWLIATCAADGSPLNEAARRQQLNVQTAQRAQAS